MDSCNSQQNFEHSVSHRASYGDELHRFVINEVTDSPITESHPTVFRPVYSNEDNDDVDIDVVNVSTTNNEGDDTGTANKVTPCKNTTEPRDLTTTTRYSTPVSEKSTGLALTLTCSPIKSSVFQPPLTLSLDSSGYSSSTPVSSTKSHSSRGLATSDRRHIGGTPNSNRSTPSFDSGKENRQTSNQSCSPDRSPHYPQKNSRTTYTSSQVRALEKVFQTNQYPEVDTIEEISAEINVAANKIKVWFQNKRARTRRFLGVPLQNTMMPGFVPPVIGNTSQTLSTHFPFMPQHMYLPTTPQIHQSTQMANFTPMSQFPAMSPMQLFYQGALGHCLPGVHPAFMTNGPVPQQTSTVYPEYNPLGYPYPPPFMYQQPSQQDDPAQPNASYLPINMPYSSS